MKMTGIGGRDARDGGNEMVTNAEDTKRRQENKRKPRPAHPAAVLGHA